MKELKNGIRFDDPSIAAPDGGVCDFFGHGAPDASNDANVLSAKNGSTYRRTDGGKDSTFYVKVAGNWKAIA